MSERPPLEVPKSDELLEALLTIPGSVGSTYSRLYNYSPRNIGFLAMQGCPPEPVATYAKWTELGRQVQRGSKAYSILRPINIRVEAKDENEDDKMIRRFKVVRALFSLSQTEGEPLPSFEPEKWSTERALGTLGITVAKFQSYDGNMGGYSFDRTVTVNPLAPNPLRTLLHEISHVEHGHTTKENLELYQTHRGRMEFEAEASAYICLNEMDALDEQTASVSRGYVQHWLRNEKPPEASLKRVLTVATRVLAAGYVNQNAEAAA